LEEYNKVFINLA
jgi:hypothetical protein